MAVRTTERHKRYQRRRTPLALLILPAAALGAAALRQQPTTIPEAPPPERVSIPVPAQPLSAGSRLADAAFEWTEYPRSRLPPGVITSAGDLLHAYAAAALPAGQPLTGSSLTFSRRGNPVADQIPPGMRAITIRVDATTAVEGWAASGSIVDLLLVAGGQTNVIAEKVKVLSVERTIEPLDGGAAPSIPTTATLLVSQEQALAIATAVPMGRLAFALRSRSDPALWRVRSFLAEDLRTEREERRPAEIRGYASYGRGSKQRRFVLSGAAWIRSTVKPRGFLENSSAAAD